MIDLTPDETLILRKTLGLNHYQRSKPNRNHSAGVDVVANLETIANMIDRGLMVTQSTFGPGGREVFYAATDVGTRAVLDQPWKD